MPNQSGKIALISLLLILVLVISFFFYLQVFKKSDEVSLGTKKDLSSNLDDKKSDVPTKESENVDFSEIGIKLNYPPRTLAEKFPNPQEFGSEAGVVSDNAYKVYFNTESNLDERDSMYSGLTMFFIRYPTKGKISLVSVLPKIEKDEKNEINVLKKIRIGQFEGYEHTQCCYSGGVIEYYFLNSSADLILIKAYNYGPDHDTYSKTLESIMNSLAPAGV